MWYLKTEDGYSIPLKEFGKIYYEYNEIPQGGINYGSGFDSYINQCDEDMTYYICYDSDGNMVHGLIRTPSGGYAYVFENGRVYEGIIVVNGVEYQSEWI